MSTTEDLLKASKALDELLISEIKLALTNRKKTIYKRDGEIFEYKPGANASQRREVVSKASVYKLDWEDKSENLKQLFKEHVSGFMDRETLKNIQRFFKLWADFQIDPSKSETYVFYDMEANNFVFDIDNVEILVFNKNDWKVTTLTTAEQKKQALKDEKQRKAKVCQMILDTFLPELLEKHHLHCHDSIGNSKAIFATEYGIRLMAHAYLREHLLAPLQDAGFKVRLNKNTTVAPGNNLIYIEGLDEDALNELIEKDKKDDE